MLGMFILCVFGSIFLSILAASLLWKYATKKWIGFLPVISMPVIGGLMIVIFLSWYPDYLTLEQEVVAIYLGCLAYFVAQLGIVVKITHSGPLRESRMNPTPGKDSRID